MNIEAQINRLTDRVKMIERNQTNEVAPFMTTEQVANALGMSTQQVRVLYRKGKLKATKPFGNRLFFDRKQVYSVILNG